ncbi:MAG: type II toxin-antitoxin system HicB family antitoxin [Nitrospirae bacterium]|nr:type II toxin-antitoxin system HicB family antitoxin [Nitrospirota bacterium]
MKTKLNMIYWKGEKFWVGKLLERPDIMTQGKTLNELEENMKEAYVMMTMEDVPSKHKIKKLELAV